MLVLLAVVTITAWKGYSLYHRIFSPNVAITEGQSPLIYIHTGAQFSEVRQMLVDGGWIKDEASFLWVARLKKYDQLVKPGRYRLKKGMSNEELVNMLRSGNQEPLRVSFNNIHTPEQLAGILGHSLEPDSLDFLKGLKGNKGLAGKGIHWGQAFFTCFPNSYDFYWTTDVEKFLSIMLKHYLQFWTDERVNKAEAMGFSVKEVTILASIVEMESWKRDEQPTVAGVYINRLKTGMRLQADPTVIYAVGDFSIRRVNSNHLDIDSPYNTYRYSGLPPGPICLPSQDALKSVLNYKKHDYYYFCAKEDLSGYHVFSKTYDQHLQNRRRYQQALDRMNIH
ncbi:MAG: endolytic transglycosylase MltG [Flavobacteriales bacterium]|nr:endolytic transglycosylase MltG [Flavobacteriales bacterium]MCB9447861.1 endolytic transglycosylase MltG [Flavobacteriales bacterium]